MSWFFFALAATFGWGLADLFYKKGSEDSDRYSHLKIAVWVGLVMGLCSFAVLPFTETLVSGGISEFFFGGVKYLPASLSYIVSMVIGYAGLRYLELSIISPVQNASGAFSALCIAAWFLVGGRFSELGSEFSALDVVGTAVIVCGVILLALAEHHLSREVRRNEDKKYRVGARALLFPLLYCLFDTVGTAADGIILDEETGLGLGEFDVIVLYGFTFFLAGIGCWLFLLIKEKKPYNPFARSEYPKGIAAIFEQAGQIFYVFAMAEKPILSAPMIASYCIVSMILSRIFLKEKLTKGQYFCLALVVCGIVLLGVSEGLAG